MNEPDQKLPGILSLLNLTHELEKEGQYNIAKLARATADSFGRQAAFRNSGSRDIKDLSSKLESMVVTLANLYVDKALLTVFQNGALALAAGRIPSIDETPHPHVCSTCGHLSFIALMEKCPTCRACPNTFQWFATTYWLDAFDPPEALRILLEIPGEIAGFLDGLSEQDLAQEPQECVWAIRNIVTHLREVQDVLDYRLELFSKDRNPVLEEKAVWSWATHEAEHHPTTLEIFEVYKNTRTNIFPRLNNLPIEYWWRAGQHEEFVKVTLKQQVSYFAATNERISPTDR